MVKAFGLTYIGRALNLIYLFQPVQPWAQPAMNSKHPIADNSSHRHAVEAVRKRLPKLHVISALALVEKAI